MIKNKKILGLISGVIVVPTIVTSCSIDKKIEGKTQEQKQQVIFRLAQGKNWPLAKSIEPLVKYYNETQKDQPDFLPVKTEYAEDIKIFQEFELIKDIKQKFDTNQIDKIPNLILGDQTSAYIINQNRNLLDLSNKGINKNIFNPKIANLHAKLAGQDEGEKLYNLPFDNADTDALLFNLDLMHLIFELIKKGGGQVDASAEIVQKALAASKTGSNVPENSIFNALEVKSSNVFANWVINDQTFNSIKSIRDFTIKFHEGVQLNSSKINDKTIEGEIFSIDYQEKTFIKELASINENNKGLFSLEKTNDSNEPTKVKYNLLTDDNLKNDFKNLWNEYNQSLKRYEAKLNNDKKVFYNIKYMANANTEWGNWEVLKYRSAISFAASVGANMSKQTTWSKFYFVDATKTSTPEDFKTYTQDEDVLLEPQVLLGQEGKRKIFSEGGSSFIPINVGKENLNKATSKFIKWIYTGQNDILEKGVMEDNWKTFSKTSGYLIPLKEVVTQENYNWIEQEINRLISVVKADTRKKEELSAEELKKREDTIHIINFLRSAKVSLKSILEYNSNNDIGVIDNASNDKTGTIIKTLQTQMLNKTNKETKADFTPLSAEELLNSFKEIIKK